MEPLQLWAAVEFTAQNGSTDALLSQAAANGLHPYHIAPLPGGFRARCAAWRYPQMAHLARRLHVRLRIRRRYGLFFLLRPLLRRTGLWAGILVFVPLLLWSQSLVWAVDASALTAGQRARAEAALRSVALYPGSYIQEEKLTAGEYALLRSGEFSWASLNFDKGRLTVEIAAAKPKPEIASGTLHGIRARYGGTVTQVNLISGTMLVTPGQIVETGQGLIGTARSERDGTLIFMPAAGSVKAQLEWSDSQHISLKEQVLQLTGEHHSAYRIFALSNFLSLPDFFASEEQNTSLCISHWQPEFLGLPFPCFVEESCSYEQLPQTLCRSEEQALALARMRSLQALYAALPDARITAQKEDVQIVDLYLNYSVVYTVTADICG